MVGLPPPTNRSSHAALNLRAGPPFLPASDCFVCCKKSSLAVLPLGLYHTTTTPHGNASLHDTHQCSDADVSRGDKVAHVTLLSLSGQWPRITCSQNSHAAQSAAMTFLHGLQTSIFNNTFGSMLFALPNTVPNWLPQDYSSNQGLFGSIIDPQNSTTPTFVHGLIKLTLFQWDSTLDPLSNPGEIWLWTSHNLNRVTLLATALISHRNKKKLIKIQIHGISHCRHVSSKS